MMSILTNLMSEGTKKAFDAFVGQQDKQEESQKSEGSTQLFDLLTPEAKKEIQEYDAQGALEPSSGVQASAPSTPTGGSDKIQPRQPQGPQMVQKVPGANPPLSGAENMPAARGIRNNNPGNIDRHEDTNWQGALKDQSGDSRFVMFKSPEYGLRALGKLLENYKKLHGIDTITKAIERWAPRKENDTDAYISAVAKTSGIDPNKKIDLTDEKTLTKVMRAIIKHENGEDPYTDEQIKAGIDLI